MNKLIQSLALLAASVLLAVSLLSCTGAGVGSNGSGNGDNAQADGNHNSDSNGSNDFDYTNLTPEAVYQAMLVANSRFTATATFSRSASGSSDSAKLSIEKDTNVFRLTESAGSYTDILYYDLNTHYWYEQSDGEWVYETEEFTTEDLLAMLTQDTGSLLFEDDNYHPYNTTAGYLAKTDALNAFFEGSADQVVCTLSMTPGEDGYTYLLSVIADEIVQLMELKISFTVESFTLPDAEPMPSTDETNQSGTNSGITSGNATSEKEESQPNYKEEETQPETTTPSPAADYLPPSDLFKTVAAADEIVLNVMIDNAGYSVQKTADLALVTRIVNGASVSSIYYDLESGYSYSYLNDRWNENYVAYDWASLLQQLGLTASSYLFRDSCYGQFESTDTLLSVESALLQDSDIASATWERMEDVYVFTETAVTGQTVSYVIRLNEDTDVTLPDMN